MRTILLCLVPLASLLSACGGGGSSDEPAPASPSVAALIRFETSMVESNTVTVAPITGASGLATRDVVKVSLRSEDGPVQVLALPNAANAAGQPLYSFAPLTPNPGPFVGGHNCAPWRALEITVTDVAGFSSLR